MLKSKEKLLFTKERKLKEMEKKLHMTEISMSDQLDQNEYSKTYILTMEHGLKELESTNGLLKMKMLHQKKTISAGGMARGDDTAISIAQQNTKSNSHTDAEWHAVGG